MELANNNPERASQLVEALEAPFAMWIQDEVRLRVRAAVARHAGPLACATAIEAFEPFVPWTEPFLRLRRDCYQKASHPLSGRAERELGDYRSKGALQMWWGLLPEEDVEANELEIPEGESSNRSLSGE